MTEFDAARLARIDAWMRRYVEAGRFPGSTFLLASGGRIVHRASAGLRDVAGGKPFGEDTIARIFSMTKPVVSVAIMMLAERGLFHLDAPVSRFLPEFEGARALRPGAASIDETEPCAPPTLHQLLTHTSGLTYGFNPGPLSRAYAEARIDFGPSGPGLAETVKRVAALPLAFVPGTRWEYSVSTDILGRVVEAADGRSLDRFLTEEILGPLGMRDTFFTIPDDRLGRLAHLYTAFPDGAAVSLGRIAEGTMREVETAEGSAWRTTRSFSGGGGLLSTVDDYLSFAEMLRKGGSHAGAKLLSPATVAFMRRNHLPGDIASMGPQSFAETPMTGMGFGLGGSVVLDPGLARAPGSVGDFSWGGIASTFFWIDPVLDLTAIFLTQLTPSSAYPARPELKALVHGAVA